MLTHVNIIQVDENQIWNIMVCTSCNLEVEAKGILYFCSACQRIVPYPEIRYAQYNKNKWTVHQIDINKILKHRFRLVVLASDSSGTIQVVLHDREIRQLIGKRARQVVQEVRVSYDVINFFSLSSFSFDNFVMSTTTRTLLLGNFHNASSFWL